MAESDDIGVVRQNREGSCLGSTGSLRRSNADRVCAGSTPSHCIEHARIICVECDDFTRIDRLTIERLQPELANENMLGWSRYLHQEAIEAGYEVFDTTGLSPAGSTAHVLRALQAARVDERKN